jgi:hypothetical protein
MRHGILVLGLSCLCTAPAALADTRFVDVHFRVSDADPYATSIQCPLGTTPGCTRTDSGAAVASVPADYRLLPGVLHAHKIPPVDLGAFIPAVPPVQ